MIANWTQPGGNLPARLADLAAKLRDAIPLLVAAQTKAVEGMARAMVAVSPTPGPAPGATRRPLTSSLQPASGGDA